MSTYESGRNNMEKGMRKYENYCSSVRPERTQFDKELQNMWCPSCCGPTGPTGPTGPSYGPNSARYSSAVEDMDFRGNVNVAGVN